MTSTALDRARAANPTKAIKVPCRVATTANITLSGEQTIDGVAVVSGDRVLVKSQTNQVNNGIYVCDTGSWSRAVDFDGNEDIVKGTLVRINEGSTNADAWFVVSSADEITIDTDAITFSRENLNLISSSYVTASLGQTVVNVGLTYQIGGTGLAVYVNGLRQRVGYDYTETTATQVTFTYGLQAGDEVDFYAGQQAGSLVATAATGVAVTDSGDYYINTTVEGVLQEIGLANAIANDNGDASVTVTWGTSAGVQRWNTALTANRTATLSTSNAKEGARFLFIRGAGATGNFTLTIGGAVTLRAPGEWCVFRYDTTAGWVLAEYGILPSADVLGMSSDKGDADATLTVGSSERTARWATPFTNDRTATLATTGAWNGARMTILRTEAASGNASLSVVVGSTRLLRLAPGQWCTVEYNGSTWLVTGFGDTRQAISSVVELRDEFLGEEINGYLWQSLIGTDAECRQATMRADQAGGVVRLTTGDDAAATMAVNGVQMQSRLNWQGNKGGLSCEFRVALDTITNVCLFVGLTDQVSVLEMPFTLAAGDVLTSNATDAVGVLFDTAADNDGWWLVGVAANLDAAKEYTAVAPVAGTFETWRIEINGSSGSAIFYRNGVKVGSTMDLAVTPAAQLTPVVAAFSRTNASRNVDVDAALVQQIR